MEFIVNSEVAAALLSLTTMEIVLGIDNIIFISILSSHLPNEQRQKARLFGLALAMLSRIALLCSLAWVMSLKQPLFQLAHHSVSGRDLLLLVGGGFLIAKATKEIHNKIEIGDEDESNAKKQVSFWACMVQIMILDMIFSLDSVITAVGMVDQLWIMIVAVMISVFIMMLFSGPVSSFINKHPTVKMLALSFLLLIGVVLVGDGLGHHVSKGYIYGAMAFSAFVECLNLAVSRRKSKSAEPGLLEEGSIVTESETLTH